MRIETAENCVNKLLQYAKERTQSDAAIYSNTRERIYEIINNCREIADLLSEMVCDTSTKRTLKDSMQSANAAINISVVSQYAKTLRELTNVQYESKTVATCARLLWEWFDYRILRNRSYTEYPLFKCDYRRFKRILYALVIMFGYHVEHNSVDLCLDQFELWKSRLGKSEKITTQYATPWEVYQIEIKGDSKYANLTSVVLWDILLDNGLSILCDRSTFSDTCILESGVWAKVEELNPNVLDGYVNYKNNPDILYMLNISD